MSPAGKARMRTSIPGTRSSPGFTLIELSEGLTITGVRVEGEDRPPDIVTEIRYLPGGKIPAFRIFFRESGGGANPPEWTLRVNPTDGSVDILEGNVTVDA